MNFGLSRLLSNTKNASWQTDANIFIAISNHLAVYNKLI